MRKILSLVMVGILFISFNSELNAQWGKKNKTPVEYPENFDKELFELRYEEVVELEQNINKEEVFDKLERFVIYNYKSPDDVVQKNDRENSVIITKGLLPYTYPLLGIPRDSNALHILDLRAKDNKYRISISGLGTKRYDETYGLSEMYYRDIKKFNKVLLRNMNSQDEAYKELIIKIKEFILEDINLRSGSDDW
tara:strand:- start:36 stop:620 length:585 start_codon:yes stop_codon:yes gene_type:complete